MFFSLTVQAGSLSAHLPIVVEHINCWFSLDFCVTLLAVRLAPQICSWLKFNLHCRGCSQHQLAFTTFSTSVVAYNINCRGCSQHQSVFTSISTFVVGTHCTHAVHAPVFTFFGWFSSVGAGFRTELGGLRSLNRVGLSS